MASKKSEAFNLLQMYQDDDDLDHELHHLDVEESESEPLPLRGDNSIGYSHNQIEDLSPNDAVVRMPVPQYMVSETARREKAVIVDYAHDDVTMSPEHEEGESLGSSMRRVMSGEDLGSTRDVHQMSPMVNVQTMTPNNKVDSPQLSAQADALQADAINSAVKDSEADDQEGVNMSDDRKDIEPLDKFLSPPPKEKCSDELQEKINRFLAYKRQGKSFNVEMRNRKDYRNPDFLRHAVRYQDINEIGSCFRKDVFDPHGYDERDFYDAIAESRC